MYRNIFQDYLCNLYDQYALQIYDLITKPLHKYNEGHPCYATQNQEAFNLLQKNIPQIFRNCFYQNQTYQQLCQRTQKVVLEMLTL